VPHPPAARARAGDPITLQLTTPAGRFRSDLVIVPRTKVTRTPRHGHYARFMTSANRPGARILEIGSLATSPGARPRRSLFPRAASFTGIDIHPGPGVDLVADIAALFGPAAGFDILGHGLSGEVRIVPSWHDSMVELPLHPSLRRGLDPRPPRRRHRSARRLRANPGPHPLHRSASIHALSRPPLASPPPS
jgi:hypothetical protein